MPKVSLYIVMPFSFQNLFQSVLQRLINFHASIQGEKALKAADLIDLIQRILDLGHKGFYDLSEHFYIFCV